MAKYLETRINLRNIGTRQQVTFALLKAVIASVHK